MTITINGTTGIAGVDGTASVPAFKGNDTDTGIYYPTANTVAAAAGGTPVWNAASTFGFKNRIINGAMQIWQRGTSFTLSSGVTTYTADRWYVNTTGGTGGVSITGSAGSYSMRITGASGISSGFFGQKIESLNIADLAGSTVTYKIRASSSVLTSLSWFARFPTAQDNYASVTLISSGSITINSTPTDYSFQIALPSGAINGLEVYFQFGSFTSGTLDITSVQLEAGPVVTSFDTRSIGTELALCQRYYQIWHTGWAGISGGSGFNYTSGVSFGNNMRAAPTMGVVSQTNSGRYPSANYFVSSSTQYGVFVGYVAASAGGNDSWAVTGTASAEL